MMNTFGAIDYLIRMHCRVFLFTDVNEFQCACDDWKAEQHLTPDLLSCPSMSWSSWFVKFLDALFSSCSSPSAPTVSFECFDSLLPAAFSLFPSLKIKHILHTLVLPSSYIISENSILYNICMDIIFHGKSQLQ